MMTTGDILIVDDQRFKVGPERHGDLRRGLQQCGRRTDRIECNSHRAYLSDFVAPAAHVAPAEVLASPS